MLNFYISSVNFSPLFCIADIITDTFETDLQLIENGNIHQHVYIVYRSPESITCAKTVIIYSNVVL